MHLPLSQLSPRWLSPETSCAIAETFINAGPFSDPSEGCPAAGLPMPEPPTDPGDDTTDVGDFIRSRSYSSATVSDSESYNDGVIIFVCILAAVFILLLAIYFAWQGIQKLRGKFGRKDPGKGILVQVSKRETGY